MFSYEFAYYCRLAYCGVYSQFLKAKGQSTLPIINFPKFSTFFKGLAYLMSQRNDFRNFSRGLYSQQVLNCDGMRLCLSLTKLCSANCSVSFALKAFFAFVADYATW